MAEPDNEAAATSSTDVQPDAGTRRASASNIDIFLRVRPVNKPSPRVLVDAGEGKVEFVIPREASAGLVNNSREHYEFKFNAILAADAKQDEVFERVARQVVVGAMEGFNGTIFAYGQTGSGKTFTITGGAERYVDRGIIPRSISCIFSEAAKRGDYSFQVHITYLEIYNEMSYDLLDPNREVKAMEDLPQVHIMEDEEQRIHFRNLTIHRAGNEEDALNLLFLGDTNRTISETPMNMASSRSHCIFTIHIEARKAGEDTVRRSKLHLVDLAGSERAHKTGIDGATLREAKYINLSLHYLEQVIVALQERAMGISRSHVPYRNSVMTTVLRDSLGGNCRTVMVATINSQLEQLEESISTCRFAQRVAMVRNEVAVNEEVDPTALIRRLRAEVRELKEEIRLLKGGAPERGPLTANEKERLAVQVAAYCAEAGSDSGPTPGGGDMMLIRACYDIFRDMVRKANGTTATSSSNTTASGMAAATADDASATSTSTHNSELHEQLKKLRLQVVQRDNEINILVSMLRRREAAGGAGAPQGLLSALPSGLGTHAKGGGVLAGAPGVVSATTGASYLGRDVADPSNDTVGPPSTSGADDLSALLNTNLLSDRNKAFEVFRKSYRQNEVIEENKALLKQKYEAAKALGSSVNGSKERINALKMQIEQRRVQRSMAGEAAGPDQEEEHAKELIEKEKASYKEAFTQLRDLKGEIEHLHMLLENSRQRLQTDFRQWLTLMTRQQQQHQQQKGQVPRPGSRGGPPGALQHAGATPDMQASWGSGLGGNGSSSSYGAASSTGRGVSGTPISLAAGSELSVASLGLVGGAQLDLASLDPAVLAAARPHLTGNLAADSDIIRFYEARAKLLQKLAQQA